mmetsp:Transcript_31221/g.76121  ORF Transcript_31221/g.76121 Transcript_31221/m.76121 type:complete len:232 (-) Transcript_31221:633-1328(-)
MQMGLGSSQMDSSLGCVLNPLNEMITLFSRRSSFSLGCGMKWSRSESMLFCRNSSAMSGCSCIPSSDARLWLRSDTAPRPHRMRTLSSERGASTWMQWSFCSPVLYDSLYLRRSFPVSCSKDRTSAEGLPPDSRPGELRVLSILARRDLVYCTGGAGRGLRVTSTWGLKASLTATTRFSSSSTSSMFLTWDPSEQRNTHQAAPGRLRRCCPMSRRRSMFSGSTMCTGACLL